MNLSPITLYAGITGLREWYIHFTNCEILSLRFPMLYRRPQDLFQLIMDIPKVTTIQDTTVKADTKG